MKEYVKPDVFVTEFALNEAVAACTDTTEKEFEEQKIICVINGEEVIFYNGCTNSATDGKLVTYNGTLYYLWYNGSVGGKPSTDGEALIKAIQKEAGVSGSGWHAGPATAEIITTHNMS